MNVQFREGAGAATGAFQINVLQITKGKLEFECQVEEKRDESLSGVGHTQGQLCWDDNSSLQDSDME